MWGSEDNLANSKMSSGTRTQVLRLGGRQLCLSSHLADPERDFLKTFLLCVRIPNLELLLSVSCVASANAMLFMYEGFVLVFTTDVFLVVICFVAVTDIFWYGRIENISFLSLSLMTGRHSCSVL